MGFTVIGKWTSWSIKWPEFKICLQKLAWLLCIQQWYLISKYRPSFPPSYDPQKPTSFQRKRWYWWSKSLFKIVPRSYWSSCDLSTRQQSWNSSNCCARFFHFNIYNSLQSSISTSLDFSLNFVKVLPCGDFKAHRGMWGSQYTKL